MPQGCVSAGEVGGKQATNLNWLKISTLVQAKHTLFKTCYTVVLQGSGTGSKLYTQCTKNLEQHIVQHSVVTGKVYVAAGLQCIGEARRWHWLPCVLSRPVPPIGMVPGMNANDIWSFGPTHE